MHTPDIRPATPPLPLRKAPDKAAYHRNKRLVKKGALIEPIPGHFIETYYWLSLPAEQKNQALIFALAYDHPYWPVASFSAAVLLGAELSEEMATRYCSNVYFASDQHTRMHPRKSLPIDFIFLKDSHTYTHIDEAFRGRNRCATSIFTSGKNAASLYTPLTDTIGMLNGLIVTSPMHTILTIMRENIPYEDSLQICDELARLYHITVEDLIQFLNARSSCHDYQLLLYKLSH